MSIFAHKAMSFTFDVGNETYTLHFTETYLLYFIPHQCPSIIGEAALTAIGTVHVKPSGETFRFSADQIAGETIVEMFSNTDGRSPTASGDINDTIKHCIKVYYQQLLRERNHQWTPSRLRR